MKIKFLDDDDELIQTTTDDEPILRLTLGHSPLTLPISKLGPITGEGTIDSPRTNIPELAEAQARYAEFQRQQRQQALEQAQPQDAETLSSGLGPITGEGTIDSPRTNIPGLAEAQRQQSALWRSITHQAQPQDELALTTTQPQGMFTTSDGHLSGLRRFLALIGLGTADFGGKILMGWPAQIAASFGQIQENIADKTNEMFSRIAAKHGIPSKELDGVNPSESYGTMIAKDLGDIYAPYSRNMREAYQWVAGDNPSWVDRGFHGAGTSLGFILAGWGLGGAIQATSALSPTLANAIGGGMSGLLEAGAESGTFLLDKYAEDPTRWSDALSASQHSFSANAPTDMLISAVENIFNPVTAGVSRSPKKLLRSFLTEILTENIQEAKQTAIEQAAELTYKSGDLSLSNFLSNLENEGKKIPHYLYEQGAEVTLSTVISSAISALLALPLGHGRNRDTQTSPTQTRTIEEMTTERDRLQEEIGTLYQNADIDPTALTDIQTLQERLDNLNMNIAANEAEGISMFPEEQEILNSQPQTDTQGAVPATQTQTEPLVSSGPSDGIQETQSIPTAEQFSTGIPPVGSIQDSRAIPNAEGQQAQSEEQQKISIEHDGRTHELTVNVGEYSSKNAKQKSIFGRYIEIRDSKGNVVARYSPSTGRVEGILTSPYNRKTLIEKITNALFSNEAIFKDNGFINENGNLIEGSDKGKSFYLQRRALAEQARMAAEKRQGKIRRGIEKLRTALSKGFDTVADMFTPIEELGLRYQIKSKLLKLNHPEFGEKVSDYYSRIIARMAARLASYAGVSPKEYLASRGFKIEYDDNNASVYLQENDSVQIRNADIQYSFNPEYDEQGNIIHEATNIIKMFNTANPSTIIHETGHFYLNSLRDLFRTGRLQGQALKDWKTLVSWLGLEGIDLTKTREQMTQEERDRLTNAHEKFAVGFEKYIMQSKAPKMKLKRAYEAFRHWLWDVYQDVTVIDLGDGYIADADMIPFVGADGKEHYFTLDPEVPYVMNRMFTDINKKGAKRADKARTNTGTARKVSESYRQQSLGRQSSIRDVLNIMQTEQGRKNAGRIWADYASVSPEEAKRISDATGLDVNTRYIHTIIGSAVAHTINRHGVGNEQRSDQVPITDADFERIPDIIRNADEISRGIEKTTGNLNETIVYKKRINGHVLVVEEVRTRRGKLAFHTMRKSKSGYDYDLSLKGQPIIRERAKSEGVNVQNETTPEVQLPNALSDNSLPSRSSNVNGTDTENYSQRTKRTKDNSELTNTERTLRSIPKKIRRSNNSFLTPERYDQLALHATGRIILGNKFDLRYIGMGSRLRTHGWGIGFSDNLEDVQKYRKRGLDNRRDTTSKKDEYITDNPYFDAILNPHAYQETYTPANERHGNVYVADIPNNEMLLNWDAKISDQSDTVKKGLQRAIVRAKQLGANDAVLRRLLTAKTGEEFYQTLVNYVMPSIKNLKGLAKGYSNDMAASLLLNQSGIPGLYYANTYLDTAAHKTKTNRNFTIWNTDMIKLLSISQDSDYEAKSSFAAAKNLKTVDPFAEQRRSKAIVHDAQEISKDAETLLDMVEAELGTGKDKKQSTPERIYQTRHVKTASENYHQINKTSNGNLKSTHEVNANQLERALFISRAQMNAVRRTYERTELWLKAPNGNKSNLTEKQWIAVRTPNFKKWFGDWENDPEHASKVLDENGEPLVVWHGTHKGGFSIFDTSGGRARGEKTVDTGAWFNSNRLIATTYMNNSKQGMLYPVFINLRNPFIYDAKNKGSGEITNPLIRDLANGQYIAHKNDGYPFSSYDDADDYIRDVLGNNTKRYEVVRGDTNALVRRVRRGELGNGTHDGVIIKNIWDSADYHSFGEGYEYVADGFDGEEIRAGELALLAEVKSRIEEKLKTGEDNKQELKEELKGVDEQIAITKKKKYIKHSDLIADDFVIFSSINVKSATANNGNYSTTDIDHYHQIGKKRKGEMDATLIRHRPDMPDGTRREYHKNGNIRMETLPNGTRRLYNENGDKTYEAQFRSEVYHQVARRAEDFTLTPEAQRQMEEIRKQYEGTSQWMKAPNGKDTKLTARQWLAVRTPNFIRWFGDWINAPQNASKVMDENGEPRVFYRGVPKNTDTLSPVLKSHNPTRPGVFYTSSLEAANSYTLKDNEYGVKVPIHKKKIYEVFLNIRNPYVVKGNGALWSRLEPTYAVVRRGGNKFKNVVAKDFKSIQEALDFMQEQNLDEGQFKAIEWGTKTTDQIIDAVLKGDKGLADNGQPYDGVIFERIEDVMAAVFTDENYIADVPVVFSPNQAKSATRNNGNFDGNDQDHYHQSMRVDEFTLTPEARRQMEEVRRQYEETNQWLKTPNGKRSKLTEQQWLAVRTPNFIRWFGDWINNPENASKILDENGEPLVVYHGSWADNSFSIFKIHDAGAWFTPLRQNAEPYTKLARNKKSRRIYPVFLNVRNPYIFDAKGRNWDKLEDIYIEDKEGGEPIRVDENGEPFTSTQQAQNFIANALPFEDGFYHGRYNVHSTSTTDVAKAVYNGVLGDGNYDGLIIKDVTDPNPHMDDYIVYLPENIKSATNNNGEYDTANPDHYHQISKLKNIKNSIQSALSTPTISLKEAENIIRADEAGLTPEARRQVAAIRKKYQGTKYWMKAPDGEKTNLTELQWLLVRTPNFKRWFGDWENNPENASKILDENGEPLVLYHGGGIDSISVFSTPDGVGAWFTPSLSAARHYVGKKGVYYDENSPEYHNNIYPVFLNIRNPYTYDAKGHYWTSIGEVYILDDKEGERIYTDRKGNPFTDYSQAQSFIDDVLAKQEGYNKYRYIIRSTYPQTTDDLVEGVWTGRIGEGKHDGVVIKNVEDPELMDDYVIYAPVDIKSATKNNGEFNPADEDHYHQIIGVPAARRLDDNERVTTRMDNFKLAQKLEKELPPAWRFIRDNNTDYSGIFVDDYSAERYIWLNTGWFRGADGQWRYELPYGTIEQGAWDKIIHSDKREDIRLEDFFDAPELFGAYPDLRGLRVSFKQLPKGVAGRYTEHGTIDLDIQLLNDIAQARRFLIHEIQHAIQHFEGFALGGNEDVGYFFKDSNLAARGGFNKFAFAGKNAERKAQIIFDNLIRKQQEKFTSLLDIIKAMEKSTPRHEQWEATMKLIEDNLHPKYREKFLTWFSLLQQAEGYKAIAKNSIFRMSGYDAYGYMSGEVEARNAAKRSDMSEDKRRSTYPKDTQIIKDEQQLVFDRRDIDYSKVENYHQTAIKINEFMLTPEAKKQIAVVRKQYKGTEQWLKAPNGKDTKLTEQQWLAVRTPNFKRWFGDWENDPKNASKILDENGEPLVVYHGTPIRDIRVFKRGTIGWLGAGIYFTSLKIYANHFSDRGDEGIMQVFLNLRNPLKLKESNPVIELLTKLYGEQAEKIYKERYDEVHKKNLDRFNELYQGEMDNFIKADIDRFIKRYIITEDEINKLLAKNYDGIAWDTEFSVLIPTQIKSATRNNGMYSTTDPDHYHQIIGEKGTRRLDMLRGSNKLINSLDIAKEMTRAGKDAKTIRLATGWEIAPDGKWRYELDDGELLWDNVQRAYKKNKKSYPFSLTLKEIYDNLELFKAYPQLSKLVVSFSDNINYTGVYIYKFDDGRPRIILKAGRSEEKTRSTLVHEIQHAIQHIEGFAEGGQMDNMIIEGEYPQKYAFEFIQTFIDNIHNDRLKEMAKAYMRRDGRMAQNILLSLPQAQQKYGNEILDMIDRARMGQMRIEPYMFLGGEVEAFNVSRRLNLSHEQRKSTLISDTQGTSKWLINRNGEPSNYSVISRLAISGENYHQIIGVKGARALDEAEGNTIRMDNLKVAEKMKNAGKDAKTIRFATGWEIAPDGKWRYEVQDANVNLVKRIKALGILSPKKAQALRKRAYAIWDKKCALNDKIPERLTNKYTEAQKAKYRKMRQRRDELLDEYFALMEEIKDKSKLTLRDLWGDDNEVLKAYPQLASIKIEFRDLQGEMGGYWDEARNLIVIEQEGWGDNIYLNNSLIHEVQHAIQDIEGVSPGIAPEIYTPFFSKVYDPLLDKLKALNHTMHRLDIISGVKEVQNALIDEVMSGKKSLDEGEKAFFEARNNSAYAEEYKETQKAIDEINEKLAELDKKYDHILHGARNDNEAYMRTGGEIEARNTEERRLFTPEQRKSTTLADTQDRNTWIIDPEHAMQDLTAPANFVPTDFSQSAE